MNIHLIEFQEADNMGEYMSALNKLRSFLEVDQVSILQLQGKDQIQVIAESTRDNRPSALSLPHYSLGDLLPHSRQLLFQFRIGAMVNIPRKIVFKVPPSSLDQESSQFETMTFLSDDSLIFQDLADIGVNFYLMMPISHQETVWGLLTAYHSTTSIISTRKLEVLRVATKQISLLIPEHFHQNGSQHTPPCVDLEFAQQSEQQLMITDDEPISPQPLHDFSNHFNIAPQQSIAQLQQLTQQQKGLSEVLTEVQVKNDPKITFQTVTQKLCYLLQAERISVYRFNEDWSGEFIHDFEYVTPTWQRVSQLGKNTAWNDTYLQEKQGGRYQYNETFVVDDIYQAGLSPCHIEILKQFHIKALATTPVFIDKQLWGILAAYQHSHPRHWRTTDVLILSQAATTLSLALQRVELNAKPQPAIRSCLN